MKDPDFFILCIVIFGLVFLLLNDLFLECGSDAELSVCIRIKNG